AAGAPRGGGAGGRGRTRGLRADSTEKSRAATQIPAAARCYASRSASGARLPAPDGRAHRGVSGGWMRRHGSTRMTSHTKQPPQAVGLYDPRYEHDACGVGMVARLDNEPTHDVIARSISALECLEHRGASGADATTGDGAGILMQMPD